MELVKQETDGSCFYDENDNVSVFEDRREETPAFYAWHGKWEDRRAAARTPNAESLEQACQYLEYSRFQCSMCGKVRSRRSRKRWYDECEAGGDHVWEPMADRKKKVSGRKINIWLADAQLDEIDRIIEETGNDRAAVIRELIAMGAKSRRNLDNPRKGS